MISEYVSIAEINGLVTAAILVRDPDEARDAARFVGRRLSVRRSLLATPRRFLHDSLKKSPQ
jgi:hypothetical protein